MTRILAPRPCRILLATDLTCRCDRALDRAVQLSQELNAELVAAYVADPHNTARYHLDSSRRSWRKIPDPLERKRWQLERYLGAVPANARGIVVEGDAAEKLVEIAEREKCDLIVTGTGNGRTFNSVLLGSTINRVLRAVAIPILAVHDRPAGAYRNIAVASDFSDASFQALEKAAALFPQGDFTLFHAYDLPFGGFIMDRDIANEMRSIEKDVTAAFLKDGRIPSTLRGKLIIEIGHGSPDALLGDFVEDKGMELTVIGSHGRGAAFDALIGSTAKRLVDTLEGDLLIVRYQAPSDEPPSASADGAV
jgi:nucleotide-binding universal stress UspA family protein